MDGIIIPTGESTVAAATPLLPGERHVESRVPEASAGDAVGNDTHAGEEGPATNEPDAPAAQLSGKALGRALIKEALDRELLTVEEMNDFPAVTGISGRQYVAVNLLTEMPTRHQNFMRRCLEPVHSLVVQVVLLMAKEASTGSVTKMTNAELMSIIRKIDMPSAFNALFIEGLDLLLFAALYLPKDHRAFQIEDLEERMLDMADISPEVRFEGFRRFFTSNFGFSPTTTIGFIQLMLRKPGGIIERLLRS